MSRSVTKLSALRPILPSLVLGTLLLAPAARVLAEGEGFELSFERRTFPVRANPSLPPPGVFPVQLVLDDDAPEGVFGLDTATARQFLWLNRFANPGPFQLEEIWVLFPNEMDVPLGGAVQLVVYLDPDGDPATGAQLLAHETVTILAKDGNTFSVYSLPAPLEVDGPGDVLIGVVNRFFRTGVDPPPTRPAALDTTLSQGRSYFALWSGDPPNMPDLATADTVSVLGGAISGNFLIRGFGRLLASPIPTLGGAGLTFLVAALGLAGAALAGRRRKVR